VSRQFDQTTTQYPSRSVRSASTREKLIVSKRTEQLREELVRLASSEQRPQKQCVSACLGYDDVERVHVAGE